MHQLTDTNTGAVVDTAEAPWTWDAAGQGWRSGQHLVMDPGRVYAPAAAAPSTIVRVVDFLLLFTIDEHAAIRNSADQKVQVFYFILTGTGAQTIDLRHDAVTAGVAYCQQAGLITADRAARILAGQPPG